ncbi:hypothetical protein RWE15_01690 [Virgibacillus halophilus]|uniref:Lipoprotein n=1 Tax=Tigheibacillus halophilus TaxID=361280 RepID=A0ABU5C393_9BACI|nr:hypothetical protein [Virgibacillus halophilus]
MFKKYSVFAGCIFLAILLAGCNHDKKYAENIYFHLEKSAKQESTFAKIQKELQQSSKKGTKIIRNCARSKYRR